MKVLLVSAGSIGQRHLRNVRMVVPDAAITVWHQHRKPGETPVADGISRVYSADEAFAAAPDVAIVAGPAPGHVAAALPLAERGVHLFIEKPLATSLEEADALIAACARRGVTLLVGYNLRFTKSLSALKREVEAKRIGRLLSIRAEVGQYLPDWRPGVDYREGVSARSDLGGGVLLELSHEIDYVRWLAGDVVDVYARAGRLSGLDIDVEDVAEIVLGFADGAIGSIHLDMLQRTPTRICRVIGSEGTLVWDGIRHHVTAYSVPQGCWSDVYSANAPDANESYLAELRHFFACVDGREQPLVSGGDGRAALQIAMAARASSAARSAVRL